MKASKYILALLLILLFENLCQSQIVEEKEIAFKKESIVDETNEILLLRNNSFLHFYQHPGFGKLKSEATFIKYDSSLNTLWKSSFEFDKNYTFTAQSLQSTSLYLLFRHTNFRDVKVVRLDLASGNVIEKDCGIFKKIDIKNFDVLENEMVIGGYVDNIPMVELVNLYDNVSKVLPYISLKNVEIDNVFVDDFRNEILVTLIDDRCNVTLHVFDQDAKRLYQEKISDEKHKLNHTEILKLNYQQIAIVGTFSDHCDDESQGFFMKKMGEKTEFFAFDAFENLFAFLKPKRRENLEQRILKRAQKGKRNTVNLKFAIEKAVFENQNLMLFGYQYMPENRNSDTYLAGFKRSNSATSFNLNTLVFLNIDLKNKQIWDYTVDLENLKTTELEQNVEILNKNLQDISYIYLKDKELQYIKIKKNNKEVFRGNYVFPYQNTMSYPITVNRYYENYFLVSGYRHKLLFEDKTVEEFYIKKMRLE